MISIIILTKNEECDLPDCLKSVHWCDDIHVLDSGSTDKTVEIAEDLGASVSFNKFEGFGLQRNFAIDNLTLKYDWILFLDADERVTDNFKNCIFKEINNADLDTAGFYCCWKLMLEDKWLKNCDNFPKWQFRIVRKGYTRFIDVGHGQKESIIKGQIKYLKEPYLHYAFSKGWTHWIERHNTYSTKEAIDKLEKRAPFSDIFSRHGSLRNVAIKSWFTILPGWPLLRFFFTYFLRLGFLEGKVGLIYCINIAYYEFLIQIKVRELKKTLKNKR